MSVRYGIGKGVVQCFSQTCFPRGHPSFMACLEGGKWLVKDLAAAGDSKNRSNSRKMNSTESEGRSRDRYRNCD